MKRLAKLLKKEDGSVAIEYALITSLIALAIVATVTALGGKLGTVFETIANVL